MQTTSPPRPRANRELWLDAAYDLFVSEGIDAVKVMPLAKRLGLSRPSPLVRNWQAATLEADIQAITKNLFASAQEATLSPFQSLVSPTILPSSIVMILSARSRMRLS
jgi:hypothetical protein